MPPKKPDYADDISDREWALLHRPTTTIPKAERGYLAERLHAYGVGLGWRERRARGRHVPGQVRLRRGHAH